MPDLSCLLSAVLFVTANILNIVYIVKERNRSNFDWEEWSNLETDYIETEWDFRLDHNALASAGGWLNAIAWAVFCFPILQLTWMLSYQGTSTALWIHVSIGILALGASMTEWIARLFWAGSNLASTHLIHKFNLDVWLRADLATLYPQDELGWLVLEINHIVASGFIWFVDAFEWLSLAFMFILLYVSIRQWRATQDTTSFGACWNNMGLLLGFFCIFEFIAQILRFEGFQTSGAIAVVFAIINRLVLMPIWILTLAFALPRAQLKQQYFDGGDTTTMTNNDNNVTRMETAPEELELSETSPAVVDWQPKSPTGPPAQAFTIDGSQGTF
jgi:hypothetical protein